jgi:hypothetical protein
LSLAGSTRRIQKIKNSSLLFHTLLVALATLQNTVFPTTLNPNHEDAKNTKVHEGQTHSTQRPEQASRSTRRPKPHWKKFFASFFQKRSAFFLFFFEKKNQKTFG